MLYTDLTKKAMMIAYRQHCGQTDKAGLPYIFHPYHLAEQMEDDEYAICVALLHDVVEDTDMTLKDLDLQGFPVEVIEALKCLTHENGVPYLGAYIHKIKTNPLARKVKLADLRHNSDLTRLPPAKDKDEQQWREKRMRKYAIAIEILESDRTKVET